VALRRTSILAAVTAALCAFAPTALAQDALPGARTHVDPAEGTAQPAATADPDAPRLTLLKSDTNAADVRHGYLYVMARCDARCEVDVVATTKIAGKQRQVATASRTLPANAVRRIRLKIRSDIRRRIAAGARFSFNATPLPPFDG
jgi:hypothetical protein